MTDRQTDRQRDVRTDSSDCFTFPSASVGGNNMRQIARIFAAWSWHAVMCAATLRNSAHTDRHTHTHRDTHRQTVAEMR